MQSLIEQVRALAEAQKECDRENDDGSLLAEVLGAYGNGSRIMRVVDTFFIEFDFPTLLAHIATQAEALKVAVEALKKYSDPHKYEDRGMGILVAPDDATGALSRIAALTGEKK